MSTRWPGRNAVAVGLAGVTVPVLAAAQGIRLYTSHNAARCGGGLGWIGPGLALYATLAVALLITLVALVSALAVALREQRWAWVVGLLTVTAAGVLAAVGSNTQASHTLVGSALGFGCSWFYPEVVQSLVPLLVAAPALAFQMTRRQVR